MAAGGMQIGVAHGRTGLVACEAVEQQGIGAKARRAAVELAHMAEDDPGTAVHGLDDAANVNIEVAILPQLADLFAVLPWIEDGKDTLLVGRVGRADVEVTSAVGQLDDIVHMRGDADVFVEQLAGLVRGDAGLAVACEGQTRVEQEEGRTSAHEGHDPQKSDISVDAPCGSRKVTEDARREGMCGWAGAQCVLTSSLLCAP